MSKVVLITGASSGIGKACAVYLAEKGFLVYGTSRKESIEDLPFRMIQMDVTQRHSVEKAISKIFEEQGRIDVLINNAGMGIGGAAELATEDEISVQMNTNFTGVVNVTSAVLPFFRQIRKGLIINISSVGGVMGIPYQGFYSASKFAVEGYSEALSLETNRFGIKVIVVEPGDFHTGFTSSRILSESTQKNNDYRKSFASVYDVITEKEINGCPPQKLAKKIYKIINKKHPGFRYAVGTFDQVLSIYLKRLIPYNWFRKILMMYYKM